MIDRIFANMADEARLHFESHRQRRSFKRGDVVYRMGDMPSGLYVIETGLVGLVYHSAKGTDHLLRVFKAGQFFGHRSYFAREPHHATSIALEATEASFLGHSDLEEMIRLDPGILRHVIEFLARELRKAELHRVMVSEQDVLARTAHALVALKDLDPQHKWTRAEIASFCASTTPTIVRALAELESRGHIVQEGREIKILNREALLRFETDGA